MQPKCCAIEQMLKYEADADCRTDAGTAVLGWRRCSAGLGQKIDTQLCEGRVIQFASCYETVSSI